MVSSEPHPPLIERERGHSPGTRRAPLFARLPGEICDAVCAEGVTKRYRSTIAVDRLSLHIPRGALYGLLGPNGAGKTTTLRMIMRILLPDEGSLNVFGRSPDGNVQDLVGYLPEERGLYPRMKVVDALVFLAGLKGVPAAEGRRRACEWLERLGIGAWAERKVIDLSKGMQQKVQFAAAVLHRPQLLILDEPFAGLDPVNAAAIKDIILDLHRRGITLILSSHRLEQVEMMCESICLIHAGRKVLEGELAEIKRQHGKNTLRIDFTGCADFLDDPALIEKVNRFGVAAEVKLRSGADAQDVLRRAVACGAVIRRFELIEPPLNDIFIEKVSQNDG
ncbi:MAG: ABC transporter ATP-binding protein [Terriglobia bacterium]